MRPTSITHLERTLTHNRMLFEWDTNVYNRAHAEAAIMRVIAPSRHNGFSVDWLNDRMALVSFEAVNISLKQRKQRINDYLKTLKTDPLEGRNLNDYIEEDIRNTEIEYFIELGSLLQNGPCQWVVRVNGRAYGFNDLGDAHLFYLIHPPEEGL